MKTLEEKILELREVLYDFGLTFRIESRETRMAQLNETIEKILSIIKPREIHVGKLSAVIAQVIKDKRSIGYNAMDIASAVAGADIYKEN